MKLSFIYNNIKFTKVVIVRCGKMSVRNRARADPSPRTKPQNNVIKKRFHFLWLNSIEVLAFGTLSYNFGDTVYVTITIREFYF